MSEDDQDLGQDGAELDEAGEETFLDKLRGAGIGTEDPTIVGDAGPTDIPPGADGEPLLVTTDEPVDHLEV